MVLDSVQALSDDEGGGDAAAGAGSTPAQIVPKTAEPEPKQKQPKAKVKAKASVKAASAKRVMEPALDPPEKKPQPPQTLKRPAAAKSSCAAAFKRPAAATMPQKAFKCFYKRDSTWGIKTNGRQVIIVGRSSMFSLMLLCSLCFSTVHFW